MPLQKVEYSQMHTFLYVLLSLFQRGFKKVSFKILSYLDIDF